ncbi:MAG: hypothetical protein EP298_10070 [Gammaproteobacteria bacterium]|nr:MAG: hypothetical protein EP298_10070 [Gammaproteobacteria bacterium]UTW41573.1 hypothetical protein KFE69_08635 [bacterium SCSIO 12844]
MTIRVVSLDFDGCMFNRAYHEILKDNDYVYNNENVQQAVISANKALFDQIISQANENEEQIILMVGSNRQNYNAERLNSAGRHPTEPSVIALGKIENYFHEKQVQVSINKLLLADIEHNLQNGTAFNNTAVGFNNRLININPNDARMDENQLQMWPAPQEGTIDYCTVDESKLAILYAQIHEIATKNPDEEIIFDFYDDKYHENSERDDLLKSLNNFFTRNSNMLPTNVTLKLHAYGMDRTKTDLSDRHSKLSIGSIQGTGKVDFNYRQTVKNMYTITESKLPLYDPLIDGYGNEPKPGGKDNGYVKHVKPEDLTNITKIHSFLEEHHHTYTQLFRNKVSFQGQEYHISDTCRKKIKNYLDGDNRITGNINELADKLSKEQNSSAKSSFFPFLKTTTTSTTSLANTPTS